MKITEHARKEHPLPRRDRLIQESRHDPYKARGKPREPSACPTCHAIFHDGRWQWGRPATNARDVVCPACQRTADGMPAGILTLSGDFRRKHPQEILDLIRRAEDHEAKEHPLKRIMQISESGTEMQVTTCEASLARSIGDAIHHAYQGELDYHYPEGEDVLRVRWVR
jgi:NMD protein affecting ribosome stability and mRNA decay